MLAEKVDYVIGVDTHRDQHTLAAVAAPSGAVVAQHSVGTSRRGYEQTLRFASGHVVGLYYPLVCVHRAELFGRARQHRMRCRPDARPRAPSMRRSPRAHAHVASVVTRVSAGLGSVSK